MPTDRLDSLFQESATESEGKIQVHNRLGELVYTTQEGGEKEQRNEKEQRDEKMQRDEKKERGQGEEAFYSEQEAGTSGLTVSYSLAREVLRSRVRTMNRQAVGIVIGICIFSATLGILISRQFHKRMKVLVEAMEQVESGNLAVNVPILSNDEIGKISASFNEMCKKLQDYINQVYNAEIQRKNAELNALQAQIDPHFLYNTLESIKAQALKAGDEKAAQMVCLLGNLFRWSSRYKEKVVYLEDELDYVKSYLELMNYRLDNRLDIDIVSEDRYLDYGIPKLILQPIIENTIRHGFSGEGEKRIVGIVVKQKQEKLEITVYDNGKGISPERLSQIKENLEEAAINEEGSSVGIRNVNQRIRLMFGNEYGVMIRSIEKMGTAIKIVIPAIQKKEMERLVQDDHSR
ncbi:sensor histidine kinase [Blautia schinkii]|nr:sensor histidine kinase [Blautia schinkii]